MELRQLEYFVAVAEEQQFTRASLRLHVAQSALSTAIQSLEREFGLALFVRSTRRVVLTEAGRVLLSEARRVLATVDEAQQAVLELKGLLRGALTIGVHQHHHRLIDIAGVLGAFHLLHPNIELRVRQAMSARLLQRVREGELDLAYAAVFGGAPSGVQTTRLGTDVLVLVCAPGHAFAGRESVDLADLVDERFVRLCPDEDDVRTVVDQLFDAAHISPRVTCEVNDADMLVDLVARDLGVSMMPSRDAALARGIVSVPLQPRTEYDLVIATSSEQRGSPAARVLVEMVREAAAQVSR